MKYVLLLLCLTTCVMSANCQTTTAGNDAPTCELAVNRSPVIRGIKLGMTLNDVLRLFPGVDQTEWVKGPLDARMKYPNLGVTGISIPFDNLKANPLFAGIWQLSLTLVDDRVAAYGVEYAPPPEGPSWPRVEDWVAKFADSYQLPPTSKWTVGSSTSARMLKCEGFQVNASNLNQRGNVSVATFELPYKEQEKRRAAFDDKLRRDFKP